MAGHHRVPQRDVHSLFDRDWELLWHNLKDGVPRLAAEVTVLTAEITERWDVRHLWSVMFANWVLRGSGRAASCML